MKRGEVYTCFFENTGNTGLNEGKRIVILLEESESTVVGVTLTKRVKDRRETEKVYTFVTIDGCESYVCIFADTPFVINKSWLRAKKGTVSLSIVNQIERIANSCNKIDLSNTCDINTERPKIGSSLGDESKNELSKEKSKNSEERKLERKEIFISHRKTDSEVADMIKNFLVYTGISSRLIFCSSLPGNDVRERIKKEVKERLEKAAIIILILSKEYYESPYCLNEAGVAWYLEEEVSIIPIGLPEIKEENMDGFLDREYKLRRLDNDVDIAYIHDEVRKRIGLEDIEMMRITAEIGKLKDAYNKYITCRSSNAVNSLNKVEDGDDYDFGDEDDSVGDHPLGENGIDKNMVDSALLLVYAAAGNGRIIKLQALDTPMQVSAAGREFMADMSHRESARWVEALDLLISCRWVRASNYKGQVFEVTGTGYDKADWFKEKMQINTDNEPLDELKRIMNVYFVSKNHIAR